MMRILAGAVARQHPDVFAAHLELMRAQRLRDATLDLVYIDDHELEFADRCRDHLLGAGSRILEASPRTDAATYAVDETTHRWAIPTFHWLAREKQRLLDLALEEGYDALWLVDSDLLCGVETLQSLLDTEKEVVSAVFYTAWAPDQAALPQVWQSHPYGFDGAGWTAQSFLRALEARELVRVRGLGACTLLRRSALLQGAAYAPLVEGLPSEGMWQGEDRHFCVRAERLHIPLFADAWPRVWHCYRPSDREDLGEILSELLEAPEGPPLPHEYVSVTLEPCEDPELVGYKEWLRGELRSLPVLPEIAEALSGMRPGESRFVQAAFPVSWPLEAYRGTTKTLRVRLLDAQHT